MGFTPAAPGKPGVNLHDVDAGTQVLAEFLLAKHPGNCRQKQKMLLRSLLRHEENKHIGDWLAVGRVEVDRHLRPDKCGDRASEFLHPRMRDGDPAAQASGSNLFAFDEGCVYRRVGESVASADKSRNFAQCLTLRRHVEPKQDVGRVQYRGERIVRSSRGGIEPHA